MPLASWFGKTAAAFLLAGTSLAASACGPNESIASASFTWSVIEARFTDPATAPSRTCDDLGVSTVRLILGTDLAFSYNCDVYAARTLAFPAGTYDARVIAYNRSDAILYIQTLGSMKRFFGETVLGQIYLRIP